MKKWTIAPALLLAAVSILSCNKNSNVLKEEAAASLIPQPSQKVKDLIRENSVTRFYYNSEGGVDSTIRTSTDNNVVKTIVFGKGQFMDSIHCYQQGYLTHRWNNIQYNNAGQLTEYTRWFDQSTGNYARYLLGYDASGNMVEQKVENQEGTSVKNTFVYNQDKALTSHSFWLFGWEQEWTIKSDNKLNPLNKMQHLFIVAEGPDEQQEQLNKYNSIERNYVPNNYIINWTNEYDQYDRLVKRSIVGSPYDTYSLTYY